MCAGYPASNPQPVKRSKSETALREEVPEDSWGWFTTLSPEVGDRFIGASQPRPGPRTRRGCDDDPGDAIGRRLAYYERERLRSLEATRSFGTPTEACYDAITSRLARALRAPAALVSLVGDATIHVKSACDAVGAGFAPCVLPNGRGEHLCAYATRAAARLDATGHDVAAVVAIPDTLADPEVSHFPWVVGAPRVRSYFGAPLRVRAGPGKAGRYVGMLCVVDVDRADVAERPIRRDLTNAEAEAMRACADAVVANLERFAMLSTDGLLRPTLE